MAKSCVAPDRGIGSNWHENQGQVNDVIVGTNKYPKLCLSPWSKTWSSWVPHPCRVPWFKPPVPRQKWLALWWRKSSHISAPHSISSSSANFHEVVDPTDLWGYWKGLNLGLKRDIKNTISLHLLETTFSNTVLDNFSTCNSGPMAQHWCRGGTLDGKRCKQQNLLAHFIVEFRPQASWQIDTNRRNGL